jgi:hypothetical protein
LPVVGAAGGNVGAAVHARSSAHSVSAPCRQAARRSCSLTVHSGFRWLRQHHQGAGSLRSPWSEWVERGGTTGAQHSNPGYAAAALIVGSQEGFAVLAAEQESVAASVGLLERLGPDLPVPHSSGVVGRQAAISKIERRDDVLLSTLTAYVRAGRRARDHRAIRRSCASVKAGFRSTPRYQIEIETRSARSVRQRLWDAEQDISFHGRCRASDVIVISHDPFLGPDVVRGLNGR